MPVPPGGSAVSWRLGLVDSAWFGSPWEGRAGFEHARRIGFESIDLFVGYDPADRSAEERRTLSRDLDRAGLPPWALLCTPLGLTDFNDGVRSFHIARAKRVLDLAGELGAPSMMLCPGEYVFQGELLPREWEWARLVDAVRQIGEHAAEKRIRDSGRAVALPLRVRQQPRFDAEAVGRGRAP